MAAPTPTATDPLSEGTSTAAALVARVLRRIEDDPITDIETVGVNDTATDFTVADSTLYEVGHTLDFQDDDTYEAVLVTAIPDATSLTVRRGHRGTTAATHAANAVFRQNPRHLSHIINEYVTEAVAALWPDLFTVYSATYTTSSTDYWYALPAGAEDVLEVYQYDTSGSIDDKVRPRLDTKASFVATSVAASNKAIRVQGLDTNIGDFTVIYTAKPAVTELTTSMADIVVLDAARMALESETSFRSRRPTQDFIFDATNKIRSFERQVLLLKEKERKRLEEYIPFRDEVVFVGRHHYRGLP